MIKKLIPETPMIEQFTESLWIAQSEIYDYNYGIIISDNHGCLIDPGLLPAEIESLSTFVASQNLQQLDIILTHSHWDHLLGTAVFPGSAILAHEKYRAILDDKQAQRTIKQVVRFDEHHKIERDQPFEIPCPTTYTKEILAYSVGALPLTLHHAPGHSADHIVICVPSEETLWAGDVLSDLEIPFIIDELAAYERTLEMIAGWKISVLIPGHGNPTKERNEISDRIHADWGYLAQLRKDVAAYLQQGMEIDEAVKACAEIAHPALSENQNEHKLNVETAFIQLGGDADPKKFGWKQDFGS